MLCDVLYTISLSTLVVNGNLFRFAIVSHVLITHKIKTKMSSQNQLQINGSSPSSNSVLLIDDKKSQKNNFDWINHSYLSKILSNYENHPIQVKSYALRPATNKGENYASAINLATIEYIYKGENESAIKNISIIIKSRIENEIFAAIEQEFNYHERESQMYNVIMKRCEELLATIGDDVKFGPRALYVDDRAIVQENLKDKGYSIMEVKNGLDYDHCQWVMKLLGKFHATTMILSLQEPELFKYHLKGNVTDKPTPMHALYKNSIETCIEYAKTVPELQKYVNKLEKFGNDIIDKMIKVFCRNDEEIKLLNHGDMWVNNLMFKKDSAENILDLLMVDYQEGYYGSPGIDLNYFIYSSMPKDVYENYKNELIEIYHKILIDTLKLLNYTGTIPTLNDIHNEILRKGHHGLTTATCILPILINEHQEFVDPENFLSDTEEAKMIRFNIFNNRKYAEYLALVLKDFEDNGIL